MNTLFIANLNYLTPESRLRDLCEKYGPIENLVMVHDLQGKPRGYAFVEYTHEDDMKAAYSVCFFFGISYYVASSSVSS